MLGTQFLEATTRVDIGRPRRLFAQRCHVEVRGVLESDALLREWGIDTVLIGSYSRHTGIHPGRDVDVFCKLTSLDVAAEPRTVFDQITDVLKGHFGDARLEYDPPRRSIKVAFSEAGLELAVDAVPAVRWDGRWGIPNRDLGLWSDLNSSVRWVLTDPERLGDLTTDLNGDVEIAERGAYVPAVRLIRQIRDTALGDEKPGGLYFELLAYWAAKSGVARTDDWDLFIADLLGRIAAELAGSDTSIVLDPASQTPFAPPPSGPELTRAAGEFAQIAADAAAANALTDVCEAAAIWRRILGENPRGWCFPLPDGCDDEGNEVAPISSVRSRGPREARGYGGGRDA
ncbi:MAG: nucleotidyltransferase [Chloroflexi bacterium]|nr:nucleotidyltransferase [Chloroflexota bacterium]MDA1147174.1 nucleotidyltransferase [Chloroflexota bacterium]